MAQFGPQGVFAARLRRGHKSGYRNQRVEIQMVDAVSKAQGAWCIAAASTEIHLWADGREVFFVLEMSVSYRCSKASICFHGSLVR